MGLRIETDLRMGMGLDTEHGSSLALCTAMSCRVLGVLTQWHQCPVRAGAMCSPISHQGTEAYTGAHTPCTATAAPVRPPAETWGQPERRDTEPKPGQVCDNYSAGDPWGTSIWRATGCLSSQSNGPVEQRCSATLEQHIN